MSESRAYPTPEGFKNSPEDEEILKELGFSEYTIEELQEQLRSTEEEFHIQTEANVTYGNSDRVDFLNKRLRALTAEIAHREKIEGPTKPAIDLGEIA
jgi:hypothetical protein